MRMGKAGSGMVLVKGAGYSWFTTISAGNAVRMDWDLIALWIDLDAELEEITQEIPASTENQ